METWTIGQFLWLAGLKPNFSIETQLKINIYPITVQIEFNMIFVIQVELEIPGFIREQKHQTRFKQILGKLITNILKCQLSKHLIMFTFIT